MVKQGYQETKKVIIEDDVWIGARSVILPGIKIGTGSIIAVRSVVTKDVEPLSIVAGVPAKLVKKRNYISSLDMISSIKLTILILILCQE